MGSYSSLGLCCRIKFYRAQFTILLSHTILLTLFCLTYAKMLDDGCVACRQLRVDHI